MPDNQRRARGGRRKTSRFSLGSASSAVSAFNVVANSQLALRNESELHHAGNAARPPEHRGSTGSDARPDTNVIVPTGIQLRRTTQGHSTQGRQPSPYDR